ncbi:hypothetical protein OG439_42095 [Amycolatopsis sp. NBC_01307]|uniref:hypothetical protein n=1 Tax=Amycolatopsis sp. NBC_01307 TaxID=2903561 RepID=UPI002E121454|nr:hypothetical protein OG439_42095 [Amycolatopsis sp. NBC_01307]
MIAIAAVTATQPQLVTDPHGPAARSRRGGEVREQQAAIDVEVRIQPLGLRPGR